MPVIVIGADTPTGRAIVDSLSERGGEVRAFVTDPEVGAALRDRQVKVAVGDISDQSHVGAAALRCFCAVLVTEAATDGRPQSFASSPESLLRSWAEAVAEAKVRRVIWVGGHHPWPGIPEEAVVEAAGREPGEVAAEVARLDEAATLRF